MDPTAWANGGPLREEAQRAVTVAAAGTILVQNTVNRIIQALTLRYLGVISELDHRPGSGSQATINRRTPGVTVGGGEWLADTVEPTEETGDYSQATFVYRTYVSRGKVTRKMQAIGRVYADNLANEMMSRLEDHTDGLENGYVVGNFAANANQINGLLTLINAVAGQVVANTTANGGAPLVLARLDEALDKVKGVDADKIIFASLKGRRLVNAALQAQQVFNDKIEIRAGFRVRTYDDIPIVATTQMPDTLTWVGASAAITVFSGSTTTALIIVNRNYVWIEDLTPTSVLPLAKTSSQFDQFDIFTDTVVVLANTKGGAILGGLS